MAFNCFSMESSAMQNISCVPTPLEEFLVVFLACCLALFVLCLPYFVVRLVFWCFFHHSVYDDFVIVVHHFVSTRFAFVFRIFEILFLICAVFCLVVGVCFLQVAQLFSYDRYFQLRELWRSVVDDVVFVKK